MKIKKSLAVLSAMTMSWGAVGAPFADAGVFSGITNRTKAEAADFSVLPDIADIVEEPVCATSGVTEDGWEYNDYGSHIRITGYSGRATELRVPATINDLPVNDIGDRAFAGNTTITSIELGNVMNLGYQLFDGCIRLKEITFPKSVYMASANYNYCGPLAGSSIEKVTFENGITFIPANICAKAENLKTVVMPTEVDPEDFLIGTRAFLNTAITSITIPEGTMSVYTGAFAGCAFLETVELPESVTSVKEEAFKDCKRMTSVSLPGVQEISHTAFGNCVSLESVSMPNVRELSFYVFEDCSKLTSLTLPKTLEKTDYNYAGNGPLAGSSIEEVVFEEGISKIPAYVCAGASSLKSVSIPEKQNVLDEGYCIERNAFANTALESVEIPDSVTELGSNAFLNCAALKSVKLSKKTESLGEEAFKGCKRITEADLGGVQKIGSNAFSGCESLTAVKWDNARELGYYIFDGCTKLTSINIPKYVISSASNYAGNGPLAGSSIEKVVFDEGIKSIPEYICAGAASLKSVTIPEKSEDNLDDYVIGRYAFANTMLDLIEIPESVCEIGECAFLNCAYIPAVTLSENNKKVGEEAFKGCKRLEKAELGGTEEVGHNAFSECESLIEVNWKNVKTLGYKIFDGCSKLTDITIPKYLTTARSDYASSGPLAGSGIENVVFEKGIADIPAYICSNAAKVKDVSMPEKKDVVDGYTIGKYAFNGTNIAEIRVPESITRIEENAFRKCERLGEISLSKNTIFVGDEAFRGCKNLKSAEMPGVQDIRNYAFADCVSLETLDVSAVRALEYCIFENCSKLISVDIPKTLSRVTSNYNEKGPFAGSGLEKITFEKGIANIPSNVCSGAENLKSVTIPEKSDNIDGYAIGAYAFHDTAIEEIKLPESITAVGTNAFSECRELKEIVIPKNAKSVADRAFAYCDKLEKVSMDGAQMIGRQVCLDCPELSEISFKNVKTIGYEIISGSTKIKEVFFPKTLSKVDSGSLGCLQNSSVEKVVFEEGIANIPAYVCRRAADLKEIVIPEKSDIIDGYAIGEYAFAETAIEHITIPESVTEIGSGAFYSCLKLREADVPANTARLGSDVFKNCQGLVRASLAAVKNIGSCIFEGCENLVSVDLCSSKALGGSMFENCPKLKSLIVPATVTQFSSNSALGNSSIETLVIGDGMEKIVPQLTRFAESLRVVYLPDSVAEFADYAFDDCIALEHIYSSVDNIKFYAHTFRGCEKLTDKRFSVFDVENTRFTANSDHAGVDGVINFRLKYQLAPSVAESASDIRLKLRIPRGMTLIQDSVQSSDLEIDPEALSDGVVSVNAVSGEVRFSARVTSIGDHEVSASIQFKANNADWEQSLGTIAIECPEITAAAPDTVNERAVSVYGLAQKGEEVTVFVNGEKAGTVTANKYTGKYSTVVALPESDSNEYTIYTECINMRSGEVKTIYSADTPVVTEVLFNYNNRDSWLDITEVLTEGASPVVSINPNYSVAFSLNITNTDKIDRVFVTSTKGNDMKSIEAFYDKKTGRWIAEGYFDSDIRNYAPGALNVSIIKKRDIVVGEEYDYESEMKFENVDQRYLDNSKVEIVKQVDNSALTEITLSDGVNSNSFNFYSGEDDGVYIKGVYVTAEEITKNPEKYGYVSTGVTTIEDGKQVVIYRRSLTDSDALATVFETIGESLNEVNEKITGQSIFKKYLGEDAVGSITNQIITGSIINAIDEFAGTSFGNLGNALSFGSDLMKYWAQIERADGNQEYMDAASTLFALKCVNTFGTEAMLVACGVGGPAAFVTAIVAGEIINSVSDYLDECIAKNQEFTFSGYIRFIIDPSGTVYEGVIGNPIEDVRVTIYYLDPETGKAVMWNAEDYEQANPLVTEEDGHYYWDVPEGQWKVVCEKDGYEKSETEWMDIPPVRTDVNIGMISKAAPEIVSAERTSEGIVVKFSKMVDVKTVSAKTISVLRKVGDSVGEIGGCTYTSLLINEGDAYSDTIIITGDLPKDVYSVQITSGLKSYAGTAAVKASAEIVDTRSTKGDVNGDGIINTKDVVIMRRYLVGGFDMEIDLNAADVNGDGAVNTKDVIVMRRYLVGGWNIEL